MHIHEYQAKTLFSQFNIQIPNGILINTTAQASDERIKFGWLMRGLVIFDKNGESIVFLLFLKDIKPLSNKKSNVGVNIKPLYGSNCS
jgi:hypothetical protein